MGYLRKKFKENLKKWRESSRKDRPHFDINTKHEKLKFVLILVKKGHGNATNDLLLDLGVSMTTLFYASGTKQKYITDILSNDEQSKEGIFAVVPQHLIKLLQKALASRFHAYPNSQGVVLVFDISALAGIFAYKYLTDYEGAYKYEE